MRSPGTASASVWRSSSLMTCSTWRRSPSDSGKTPGTDLREGVATLPMLHAARSGEPGDARLRELLGGDLSDDGRHGEALGLLRAHPAMETSRAELREWAEQARTVLEPLPDIPAKAALDALCDIVVDRTG